MPSISRKKALSIISEAAVVNIFLLNLFISSISNYSPGSYILKSAAVISLYCIILYGSGATLFNLRFLWKQASLRKLIYSIAGFLFFALISLSWSLNPAFGLMKWLNLLLYTFPAVIAFYYLTFSAGELRLRVFRTSIIILGLISSGLIILLQPFDHSSIYSFGLTRWSHVISGRFTGTVLILLVIIELNARHRKDIFILQILIAMNMYALYLTGLRAAMLGSAVLIPALTVYACITDRYRKRNAAGLVISTALGVMMIVFSGRNDKLDKRYDNFYMSISSSFRGDTGISSRMEAWKICLERIKENPLTGLGFGGFRSYYKSDLPLWMKYPHNLILEMTAELGLTGFLYFIYFMYLLFWSSGKRIPEVSFFLLFALFMAMFSKDITTQLPLLIGLGFCKKENLSHTPYKST